MWVYLFVLRFGVPFILHFLSNCINFRTLSSLQFKAHNVWVYLFAKRFIVRLYLHFHVNLSYLIISIYSFVDILRTTVEVVVPLCIFRDFLALLLLTSLV